MVKASTPKKTTAPKKPSTRASTRAATGAATRGSTRSKTQSTASATASPVKVKKVIRRRKSRKEIAAEVEGRELTAAGDSDRADSLTSLESEEGQEGDDGGDKDDGIDIAPKDFIGEFGRWGLEWMREWKKFDPVWSSANNQQAHKELLGVSNLQPLSHCEDHLFPNLAILWGLEVHRCSPNEKLDFHLVAGRGPSCYLSATDTKSSCHYRGSAFSFLYEWVLPKASPLTQAPRAASSASKRRRRDTRRSSVASIQSRAS